MKANKIKHQLKSGKILPVILGPNYYQPTDKEIDDFLASAKVLLFVNEFPFQKDVADCSWAAWGFVYLFLGLGWAVSYEVLEGHALVRILNDDDKEIWIEPQTGERVKNTRKLILTVMP